MNKSGALEAAAEIARVRLPQCTAGAYQGQQLRALKLETNQPGKSMRSIFVMAVMLAACAPEIPTVAETSGGETEGAAGSVGVQSEALNSACAQLHQYLRYWVDQNTPGTLVCGANYLSDYYQCTTSSPPINYTFTKQLESIGAGGQCAAIVYAYGTSQSNKVYQVSCTQNGAAASCSRRALN